MKSYSTAIFATLLSLLWMACAAPGEKKKSIPGNAITGLASPLKLQVTTTPIVLRDYFPDPSLISSITLDGQPLSADGTGVLLITTPIARPIGNLSVTYSELNYDLPVFKSEKVTHRFSYTTDNTVTEVGIAGSMNGWNHKSSLLKKEGDAWVIDFELNPGLYQYRIWENGRESMDKNNPEVADNGMGGLNNTFFAGDEKGEAPFIIASSFKSNDLTILTHGDIKEVLVYFENHLIPSQREGDKITIQIPYESLDLERSHLRVFAHDGAQRSNDLLIPLSKGQVISSPGELTRSDLQGTVMYFMMVDRFNDGNPENNRPTNDPHILPQANNLGGDLKGITQKIEDGYFDQLGINTLWISPISRNAEGSWGLWDKGVTSTFSAYHGYWPIALRSIDDRFGTRADFEELIRTAHDHEINVILDYVAHHVHENHPLYKQKPEWTTPLFLPDGTMNTEKWDEHRLTTWFDTFMPTFDFSKPEVVDAMSDTALFWITEYDLDGFRHDATKHIPEDFWRALTYKTKEAIRSTPERKVFQIGETYGNAELISSYISSGQMDAQFDFNLYDAAVDAFAKGETDFTNLERVLNQSLHYYGYHHLMGNITGNQDRARFISYADGSVKFEEDPKLAGWTRTIANQNETGFDRSKMLVAFLLTAPGIPCIYYGDEIGMPGGNDPDNRRMMVFEDWNESQASLQEYTTRLANYRRSSLPLMYGDLKVLKNDSEGLVYARHWFGETVITAFTKKSDSTLSVELPAWIDASEIQQSVLGHSISVSRQTLTITFNKGGVALIEGT